MVDQLSEVVKFFVTLPVVVEQAIEVPTIILGDTIPQRASLWEPQLVEQLAEVPVPSSHDCVIRETLSEVPAILAVRVREGASDSVHRQTR